MNFLCIRSFNFYPHTNSHRLFKFIGSGIFMGPLKVLEGETFRLKSTSFINFLPLFHHRSSWTNIRNRFYVCHVSTTCVIYLIARKDCKKKKKVFSCEEKRRKKESGKRENVDSLQFQFLRVCCKAWKVNLSLCCVNDLRYARKNMQITLFLDY